MRSLPRFAVLDALPEGYQRIRRITLESQRLLIALNSRSGAADWRCDRLSAVL
jgi:hypothetical protein